MSSKATKYNNINQKICQYGCQTKANFIFRNGNICCAKSSQSCSGVRKKLQKPKPIGFGQKISNFQNSIDQNTGLKKSQIRGAKAIITKKNTIINGKNTIERSHKKRVAITNYKSLIKKRAITMSQKGEDGLTGYERQGKRLSKTLHTIQDSGYTMIEEQSQTRIKSMAKLDKNGNNAWDRGYITSKRIHYYKNTQITYQCSYEFEYLQELEQQNGLNWLYKNVNNGPTINYIDPNTNKETYYKPDFLINQIIIEIKSSWWWDGNGTKPKRLLKNKAKIQASINEGYQYKLILDKKEVTSPLDLGDVFL